MCGALSEEGRLNLTHELAPIEVAQAMLSAWVHMLVLIGIVNKECGRLSVRRKIGKEAEMRVKTFHW